jgi:GNAT superfamily N-acetyltransferase
LFNIKQATVKELKQIQPLDCLVLGNKSRKTFLVEAVEACKCLVALSGGKVEGFGILDRSLFGQNFIALLIVHPDHRRKGIATALIQSIESLCVTKKLFTSTPRVKNLRSVGLRQEWIH